MICYIHSILLNWGLNMNYLKISVIFFLIFTYFVPIGAQATVVYNSSGIQIGEYNLGTKVLDLKFPMVAYSNLYDYSQPLGAGKYYNIGHELESNCPDFVFDAHFVVPNDGEKKVNLCL